MTRTIDQFMWGYQDSFRSSMESLARDSFDSIGAAVGPRAFLIGFRESGEGKWSICVEPERGQFHPEQLESVGERGRQMYAEHPDAQIHFSDPFSEDRIHRLLRDRCCADALGKTLEEMQRGVRQKFFVGHSARIGDFRIYPVIAILEDRWNSLPKLRHVQRISSRFRTLTSFHEALMIEILRKVTDSINRQEPPIDVEGLRRADDLIRNATRDFVGRLVAAHGDEFGSNFIDNLSRVVSQTYEGRVGTGTIILAKQKHPSLVKEIQFFSPIKTTNLRALRKIIEIAGENLHLLCDGNHVFGLGRVDESYDLNTESIFSILILGKGSWEFRHGDVALLRADNGITRLPAEPIAKEVFIDTVDRIFPDSSNADALWTLGQAVAKEKHGTMLVVHGDAQGETIRLAPQALAIETTYLTEEALKTVTAIDGAILVGPDARCHAIGVILDGVAVTGTGDSARGARFNSAVRYLEAASNNCMIIIVSEDGMIDLLPNLRRRVRRVDIEASVYKLEELTKSQIDFEAFYRHYRHVEALNFYMSQGQCDRVNAAVEIVEDYRQSLPPSHIRVTSFLLSPNREMNDSYFLD